MSDSNRTDFTNPSTFILLGIPGLEAAHVWISIPFCAMYAIAILGNFTILFIVKRDPSLHGPMFYFLCMLAVTDLVMSTSTLPKMLSIFWFNSREISFSACFTQMYFIHSFSTMESGMLAAMAFDRYVAICNPLRYSTTLTNSTVAKIGLAVVLRSGILTLPSLFLVRRYPYCRTNIIPHFYCGHIALVKLACADIHINSYYGLFYLFSMIGVDVFFIAVSYTLVLRAIFRLPTKDRFGDNMPLHFLILITSVYQLVPPMIHPIIYGMRTKQIRDRLLQLFTHKYA
ncbi:olfactory receptor 52E4-like [Mauremys mutica]|uniref:olfactory receptor 52E4-like n=1 Tax=Mauremys mutica TaxID=74926 RepID=UPI001D15C913|nr:olfactory receptor 52E4-like [Mauremys mutica]